MEPSCFLPDPETDIRPEVLDPLLQDDKAPSRLLSIISRGRNDNYMGNFLWRLSASLNKHAKNIATLNVRNEVELVVADWGSEVPLYDALDLTDEAREIVRFIMVPPDVAARCNGDSTYSGVHPLNTAARRTRGAVYFLS